MKRASGLLAIALLSVAALAMGACGTDDTGSTFTDGGGDGATDGAVKYDALVVEPPDATLKTTLKGGTTQVYKAIATIGGTKVDVTADCGFVIADAKIGGFAGPTFTTAPRGGTSKVTANCNGSSASTGLTVVLQDDVVLGGAPANAPALFAGAQLGADPTHTPALEYPLDGSAAPLNIPSMNAQWTVAKNDLFHLAWVSPHIALNVYTLAADAQVDDPTWAAVAESASGDDMKVTVEGLTQAQPQTRYAGAPATVTMSKDKINDTAIYWWASSKGSILTQTFGQTNPPPAQVKADCTSCHSVSRAGSRIGYSRCVANNCSQIFVGFMKYDKVTKTWKDTVDANAKAIPGSYTTFAPVGNPYLDDSKAVAMVTKNDATLTLIDPDTGAAVPSNAAVMSTHDAGQPTRHGTMPDWAPNGNSVVFTSVPGAGNWIDVTQSAIATMSYSYANATHTFGEPKFIVRQPIALPSGVYDNFFFPSYSQDGALIVFNAARAAWRNFTNARTAGQRLMLTEPTGAWRVDLSKMNGPADYDITWPHWAPASGTDFYWIVFASERDYGHKITGANTAAACKANGVTQCKQIWIGAISKTKLDGKQDPSFAPVWMPGQDIDANNISPYWTVPTSAIPN